MLNWKKRQGMSGSVPVSVLVPFFFFGNLSKSMHRLQRPTTKYKSFFVVSFKLSLEDIVQSTEQMLALYHSTAPSLNYTTQKPNLVQRFQRHTIFLVCLWYHISIPFSLLRFKVMFSHIQTERLPLHWFSRISWLLQCFLHTLCK